eukprot:580741-Prymnesium_polylepis.1
MIAVKVEWISLPVAATSASGGRRALSSSELPGRVASMAAGRSAHAAAAAAKSYAPVMATVMIVRPASRAVQISSRASGSVGSLFVRSTTNASLCSTNLTESAPPPTAQPLRKLTASSERRTRACSTASLREQQTNNALFSFATWISALCP